MNKINLIIRSLSGVLIMITVLTVTPSISMGVDNVPEYKEYVSTGNYFRCSIPADWRTYQSSVGLSEEEKKVYGIILFGPGNGSAVDPEISIHYYAPGNLMEKTMDKFINGRCVTRLAEGKRYGEVRQMELAGGKAKTCETIESRNISGRTLNPVKALLFQKLIIIPAGNNEGFYVLKLIAPLEIKDRYTGIFEDTAKSFLPGK